MTAAASEPGWYPDPRGAAHTYRWWDGAAWTGELSDDPADPAPAADPRPATAPAAPVRLDPARTAAYQRGARDPARRPRPDRLVAGVAVAVLVVAISLVVVLRSDGTVRSGPPLAPPTPVPGSLPVSYDQGSRRVAVGDVVATFPATPWVTATLPPDEPAGLFSAGMISEAAVHADYDGKTDWSASITLAAADPRIIRAGDGTATAEAVLASVRDAFYVGVETTVDTPTLTMNSVQGRPVAGLQTVVRYRVTQLPSRGDRATVLVIAPPTGSSDPPVVWLSLRPTDSSQAAADGLQRALDSLTFG